jgi:hypothetical protein
MPVVSATELIDTLTDGFAVLPLATPLLKPTAVAEMGAMTVVTSSPSWLA